MDSAKDLLNSSDALNNYESHDDLANGDYDEYEEGEGEQQFLFGDQPEENFDEVEFYDDDGQMNGEGLTQEQIDELNSICGNSEQADEGAPKPVKKFTQRERAEMIHTRAFLKRLDDKVKERQYEVDKYREENNRCRKRVEELDREAVDVSGQIVQQETAANSAAAFRLRAQLERIGQEKSGEELLASHIYRSLLEAEYELTLARIEQGKQLLTDHELRQKEQLYDEFKAEVAALRQLKERKFADATEGFFQRKEEELRQWRERMDLQESDNRRRVKAAHDLHNARLLETMRSIRQARDAEEERYREDFEKKVRSVLRLKEGIAGNRENLTALGNRARAEQRRADAEARELRTETIAAGGDAGLALRRERRAAEARADSDIWRNEQRKKQADIAARLLIEEDWEKKKRERLPYLYAKDTRGLSTTTSSSAAPFRRSRKLRMTRDIEAALDAADSGGRAFSAGAELTNSARREAPVDSSDEETAPGATRRFTAAADDDDDEPADATTATLRASLAAAAAEAASGAESLAKPQFAGMWDTFKAYSIPRTDKVDYIRNGKASHMEQEIMRRVLDQTRANIVTKQVAAGREFKGDAAFFSKPEVVHFKDFEVDQTYKQKVTLTNASYSVNSCKLVGMTDYLNNFIQIQFNPPGHLSAGMSCQLVLSFTPRINEDLSGEITFLCQTGQFSVPILCTTKKCDLSIDKAKVDFGVSVIGETLHQTLTLRNAGAKGCNFALTKLDPFRVRERTEYSTTAPTEDEKAAEEPAADSAVSAPPAAPAASPAAPGAAAEVAAAAAGDSLIEQVGQADSGEQRQPQEELPARLTDGMSVGRTSSGWLAPFSEVKLELVWLPSLPGGNRAEFRVDFDDPASASLSFEAVGVAVDVPVWLERSTVDLRVCTQDRLYQDTVVVRNRASTALKLHFQVPPKLQGHMELLPKTGYVQARSSFSAQLKFLPRASLADDAAGEFFDPATGVLEVPLTIRVAEQTRPIEFTAVAVVTGSDLEFDVDGLDFGCCTIYESAVRTIRLTNNSLLPQKFGFVGLPDYAEVQPNDGFGVILPKETISLEVVFSPDRAADFAFTLTCRTLIDRKFSIPCTGVGVHPPLRLSEQVVNFKATALQDFNDAMIYVVNEHTSMNEYSHPVPRIGKGPIAPVGPTSFEFVVPDDAPFQLAPCVGTVMPGERARIHLRLKPKFTVRQVQQEASCLAGLRMEAEARAERERQRAEQRRQQEEAEKAQKSKPGAKGKQPPAKQAGGGGRGGAAAGGRGGRGAGGPGADAGGADGAGGPEIQAPPPESIAPDSDQFYAGQASLMRKFLGDFNTHTVPCFVASGRCPTEPGTLKYSTENTLYLKVNCPVVSPQLAIISNSGRSALDFENVSLGQTAVKSFTVQNISASQLNLTGSLLDPNGPFALLNALRPLEPQQSHSVLVSFTPDKECSFHERFFLHTGGGQKLGVTLQGCGILPKVSCSETGQFDLGAVLAGEYVERQLTLTNQSALNVAFNIRLDSASLLRFQEAQHPPVFAPGGRAAALGVQNRSGQAVFDCVPCAGDIPAGQTASLTVTFAPDRVSDCYSDILRVLIFDKEEAHKLRLVGQAKPHIAYLGGGDAIRSEVECLAAAFRGTVTEDPKAPAGAILLTFGAVCSVDGVISPANRTMYVGCVRTMAVSQKKNAEYTFENTNVIGALGFSIDSVKGQVEAGTKKPVVFTWNPPPTQDPNVPVETSIVVTLRGDVTETYTVLLRAFVTSDPAVVPAAEAEVPAAAPAEDSNP
ncbi:hypothetical protein BOX15_Mlig021187g1 [Macrostomum lignano]|uniref:Abnormal spindle-like microcephaly-associated protein ASH domain-containing protein n=1 Tax=Macrostomum lignano TaxID=282301 RepID=A0A267EH42_9PLAT|nr:hypothetical protein BOX15_Mlig021187g1 [Macrostomum lignano]